MLNRNRFIKTIVYRATAIALKQTVCWILFQQFIVNVALLIADVFAGTIWYYGYETLFEKVKKKWMKK